MMRQSFGPSVVVGATVVVGRTVVVVFGMVVVVVEVVVVVRGTVVVVEVVVVVVGGMRTNAVVTELFDSGIVTSGSCRTPASVILNKIAFGFVVVNPGKRLSVVTSSMSRVRAENGPAPPKTDIGVDPDMYR